MGLSPCDTQLSLCPPLRPLPSLIKWAGVIPWTTTLTLARLPCAPHFALSPSHAITLAHAPHFAYPRTTTPSSNHGGMAPLPSNGRDALDYEFQACRNHRQLEQLLSRSLKGAYSRLARVNIYSGYLVSLPSESQTGLKVPHVIHKYIRNFLCDPGWTPPGVYPIRETKKGQDQFARKHLFVGPLLPSGF